MNDDTIASMASDEARRKVRALKAAVENVVAGKVSWNASLWAETDLLDYIARLEMQIGGRNGNA